MQAGLWLEGRTVPVTRVHAQAKIDELAGSHTTISFSYSIESSSKDALFKVQLNPLLGYLNGFSVTVGSKQTTGSFISSDKATELYGKETLESQHKDDNKEWVICNIGEVENNTNITIDVSFASLLHPSSDSIRFTIPTISFVELKDKITYPLDVDIDVITSFTGVNLSSPSHPSTSITQTDQQSKIHLSTEEEKTDFILDIIPTCTHSSHIVEKNSNDVTTGDKYAILLSLFKHDIATNVKVDWGDLNITKTSQYSTPSSRHVVVYASLVEAPRGSITLSADGVTFTCTLTENDEREGNFVHQLGSSIRIHELEETGGPSSASAIRDLGLQSGLSTPFSSVFAKNGRISLVSVGRPQTSRSESASSTSNTQSPSSQRKVYDSKFLLSFREHFTDLPEGLPPIDIILGKGGATNTTHTNKPKSQDHRKGRRQPPATPVEPLKQTDGRWVRPTNDVAAVEMLRRDVYGLLNKLTLEKFDKLSAKFAKLKLTSLDDMTEVCKLVFEKALAEQHFCSMYADLCKKLAESYPTFPITEGTQTVSQTFKRLLLNSCQKEFECTLPIPQEGQDPVEVELQYRRRTLGNIRFIGELFKLGILRGVIMHECVSRLLNPTRAPITNGAHPAPNGTANGTPNGTHASVPKDTATTNGTPNGTSKETPNGTANGTPNDTAPLPSEEDLEALCKLLQTIGKRLDTPGPDRQRVDRYFTTIAALSRNHDLPSRNRFMLLDLIDLRKNDWVPRRVVNGPKTIAAVHADAEKADRLAKEETALRESGGHRFSNPYLRSSGGIDRDGKDRRETRNRGDGRDSRGEDSGEGRDGRDSLRASTDNVEKDNGWEVVGKSSKGSTDKWEVAGSKNKRSGGFQEGKGRRDSFKQLPSPARGNQNKDSRDKKKTDKPREQPRSKQGGVPKDKEKERDRTAPAPKSNVFSSLDAMDEDDEGSSSGSATPTPRSGNTTPKGGVHVLSPAQLEARADAILDEYFALQDVPEAVESIRELQAPGYHANLIVRAINMVLERNKPNQLEQLDALIAAAFASDVDTVVRGFEDVLDNIEDLDIDIPMASRHVATLIGSSIARGTLQFSFLFQALEHLVASGKAEAMVGAALQKIHKESGETKLLEMYDSTQRNLKDLFKPGRTKDFIDTFLQSKDLAFIAERLSY